MTLSVPAEIRGLWRRKSMVWADGRTDTTTQVLWLQTASLFADLRVPADRPSSACRSGFGDYTDAELARLAAMYGFAGVLDVEGASCRWHHALDFHPPGGPADEARYALDGDILIETGIDAAYEEIWERQTPVDAPLAAFRLAEDSLHPGRGGIFVLAGDYFLTIEGRPNALPEAASLADLIERDLAEGARERAVGRLGMRIAFGRAGQDWPILLSTYPWLEGTPLFASGPPRFDPAAGTLEMTGSEATQLWRLEEESSFAPDNLSAIFLRGPYRRA